MKGKQFHWFSELFWNCFLLVFFLLRTLRILFHLLWFLIHDVLVFSFISNFFTWLRVLWFLLFFVFFHVYLNLLQFLQEVLSLLIGIHFPWSTLGHFIFKRDFFIVFWTEQILNLNLIFFTGLKIKTLRKSFCQFIWIQKLFLVLWARVI